MPLERARRISLSLDFTLDELRAIARDPRSASMQETAGRTAVVRWIGALIRKELPDWKDRRPRPEWPKHRGGRRASGAARRSCEERDD
jgi:hypothetical protein